MFRSEKMALCQMFIQPEVAYATVSKLGEAGIVQFRDLNESYRTCNRKFIAEVILCDAMERKLKYLHYVLMKEDIPIKTSECDESCTILNPREFMDLESSIDMDEMKIQDPLKHYNDLKGRQCELIENVQVLQKAGEIINDNFLSENSPDTSRPNSRNDLEISIEDSGFLTGIIETQRLASFERMIWRVSRGYALLKYTNIDNKDEINDFEKSVFVLYFQGSSIQSHILTICRGFRAKIYFYPHEISERVPLLAGLQTQLNDLQIVINETELHKNSLLKEIAENITSRMRIVTKMKAVYHILNYFNIDISNECFISECWIPENKILDVTKLLQQLSADYPVQSFLNILDTNLTPPTFYRTNKFTKGFQSLIDTYGCCSYREVNPAFLSIITFPFLFAIMFGDIGHGLILLLFGLYTIVNEKKFESEKNDNEIWNLFFFGRYIILLMGIFSMYTGFIYNDIFSKSVNIFGSGWTVKSNVSDLTDLELTLDPAYQFQKPYILGMDPVWQFAHNKILFSNSYKMKLSIIIGVLHMISGLCLSIFNHVQNKQKINIFIEFIPRMIFLLTIFGYLCALLILKWIIYSASNSDINFKPECAPSILVMFINMVLMQKPHSNSHCCVTIFDGQLFLQRIFIILAIASIPIMLLAKPLIMIWKNYQERIRILRRNTLMYMRLNFIFWSQPNDSDLTPLLPVIRENNESSEHHGLSDTFILEAIHTIEFVLSTVSHTASYLRLWALSLAHSQLSEVLWSRVISGPSHLRGPFAGLFLYGAFAGWAVLTVTVLVLMEGLSAFLHTLRLHWVEYMSKFYTGDGYSFTPFSFANILSNENYKY